MTDENSRGRIRKMVVENLVMTYYLKERCWDNTLYMHDAVPRTDQVKVAFINGNCS
jgi:hypothetical protein